MQTSSLAASGALAGIRVLDLSSVLLGPLAAQMLGDMGAEVIKVEAPAGDLSRSVGPARHVGMSSLFLGCNRNKRSLVLDLKQAKARDVLARLMARSDVVLHSVRSEAAERIGLSYEAVRASNPRVVYCHVSGFSDDGPYGGLPAFDDIIQAASGLAELQRINTAEPRYLPTLVADKVTGIQTAFAIVTALFGRERSGRGQCVRVPMFETMAAFTATEHLWGHSFDPPIGPMVYTAIRSGLRRPFPTQDGYLAVVPYTDSHWRKLYDIVGRPELGRDPRFVSLAARTENYASLIAEIGEGMRARSTEEWVAIFRDADIPAMRPQRLEELLDDPHLRAVGFWQTLDHPSEGSLRMPGIPHAFSETPGRIVRMPPLLGEHSEEVLAEFGFDGQEQMALLAAGAVVQHGR